MQFRIGDVVNHLGGKGKRGSLLHPAAHICEQPNRNRMQRIAAAQNDGLIQIMIGPNTLLDGRPIPARDCTFHPQMKVFIMRNRISNHP